MTTRVTDGARRAAALVSRVSRLCRSRARALLSLHLKEKRDCLQSIKKLVKTLIEWHLCYDDVIYYN